MKTPKRTPWQWTNEHCLKDNGELRATINEQCSRWKRKNKTAQLKRTIDKYKNGEMLPKLRDIRLAYMWLQELKKPSRDANFMSWEYYIAELKTIHQAITRALVDAAACQGAALERETRKEQP